MRRVISQWSSKWSSGNLVPRASVTFVQRRIAASGNEIGAVESIPQIAEILLLCRPVSLTDHDLFGSDVEQDCSYTVFAVVFFTLTKQFASVNRNRRLVAVFIDQFTVSTFH